ncbi:hypothetical protein KPH14_011508 [Odynerus spinipes]|uniref:Mitochondrial import inner membrane translocase subunit Tim21 n=1 Tax=Odynerus spinipes TaxID=1348599 RepID=A0AAD9VN55_9HYME|nr:hypothetical protein KPH14_011508 [Odynerus spinipes]
MRGLSCFLFRRHPIAIVSSSSLLRYHKTAFDIKQVHWYSTQKTVSKVDDADTKDKVSVDFVEVVKKNTASAGYLVFIAISIAFSGYLFYFIFHELFSSNSPLGIYNRALERCQKDTKVLDALGEPIKVYGEGTRRRNHFSHGFFVKDNMKYLRLKFYMEGLRRRGTVYVEAKDVSGNYELTYIYMKLDDIFGRILITSYSIEIKFDLPSNGIDLKELEHLDCFETLLADRSITEIHWIVPIKIASGIQRPSLRLIYKEE